MCLMDYASIALPLGYFPSFGGKVGFEPACKHHSNRLWVRWRVGLAFETLPYQLGESGVWCQIQDSNLNLDFRPDV